MGATRVGQYFNKSLILPDQEPAIQLLHAFSLRNVIALAIFIATSNNYCTYRLICVNSGSLILYSPCIVNFLSAKKLCL